MTHSSTVANTASSEGTRHLPAQLLTAATVGDVLGIGAYPVVKLIEDGEIRAGKWKGVWLIHPADLREQLWRDQDEPQLRNRDAFELGRDYERGQQRSEAPPDPENLRRI